jgi:hypothetical protein
MTTTSSRSSGGSFLWSAFKCLVLLTVFAGAVAYLLKTLNIVQF